MKPVTDQTPIMLKLAHKRIDSANFATLFFDYSLDFKPGQFVMIWIPGMDEKPYTISHHNKSRFGITIEAKGLFSKKAVAMEEGDLMGFRGPFGNGFHTISSSNIAVVAGGCGMAPLAPLVETLDRDIIFIHGARSKEFLLYRHRFDIQRQICTDDGSQGHKGFVTDLLEKEIINRKKTDKQPLEMVYTCGPEIMMHRVFLLCESFDIPCQVSLERYMRCGFGVCGACVCGEQVVCKDGPVFDSKRLRTMDDFNKIALLKSGKPVNMDQYFSWRCQS
ncbi:MAG: dihydroorotate dehydrogenase electron transfer subunit [Desulfobacteraceae bacterium]|nr:dihydroorotate dehydrogenase electron transfer subunit [Desulfobacteraceae bacterium]